MWKFWAKGSVLAFVGFTRSPVLHVFSLTLTRPLGEGAGSAAVRLCSAGLVGGHDKESAGRVNMTQSRHNA